MLYGHNLISVIKSKNAQRPAMQCKACKKTFVFNENDEPEADETIKTALL